jgi:DNA-directed RNA polymerase specialized sigma24 family protein
MESGSSVTSWIGRFKAGDHEAAQELWQRYFQRLVGLARAKLRGAPRLAPDAEDIALSAFKSFWRRAQKPEGFPQLQDRNNLWALLVVITARKAYDQMRRSRLPKHRQAVLFSELADRDVEEVLGKQPTRKFVDQVTHECRRLLDLLEDETLRSVALWKLQGFTNVEIAAKLGCVRHTVERKLKRIRELWDEEYQS